MGQIGRLKAWLTSEPLHKHHPVKQWQIEII